jgi:hypothetical protein
MGDGKVVYDKKHWVQGKKNIAVKMGQEILKGSLCAS